MILGTVLVRSITLYSDRSERGRITFSSVGI